GVTDPELRQGWGALARAMYATLSRRMGVSPEEAFALRPFVVQGASGRTHVVVDGRLLRLDAPEFGLEPAPIALPEGDPLRQETAQIPDEAPVELDGTEAPRGELRDTIVATHFEGKAPAQGRAPIAYVMAG